MIGDMLCIYECTDKDISAYKCECVYVGLLIRSHMHTCECMPVCVWVCLCQYVGDGSHVSPHALVGKQVYA